MAKVLQPLEAQSGTRARTSIQVCAFKAGLTFATSLLVFIPAFLASASSAWVQDVPTIGMVWPAWLCRLCRTDRCPGMGRKGRDSSESSESDRRAKVVSDVVLGRAVANLAWLEEKKTRKDDKRKVLGLPGSRHCFLFVFCRSVVAAAAEAKSGARSVQPSESQPQSVAAPWAASFGSESIAASLAVGSESEDSESKSSDDEEDIPVAV